MSSLVSADVESLVRGALNVSHERDGGLRPERFTPAQLRALGSCRAWHPGPFRKLAACTSGVCLDFVTDSSTMLLEISIDSYQKPTQEVIDDVVRWPGSPQPPYDGVSAEVDGRLLGILTPDADGVCELDLDAPAEGALQRLPGMGECHHVRVWLPCLTTCKLYSLTGDGTYVEPAPRADTILVLGDSIAQGFVSCDPARNWAAALSRTLGMELLNQGVGGQVCQPGTVADLASRVSPRHIIVEFGGNYRYEPCDSVRVQSEINAYVSEVATSWPDADIWVVTPIPHLEAVWPTEPMSCFDEVPSMLAQAAARYGHAHVIDGGALLDENRLESLLADGSDHPTAEGHEMIADRLNFVMEARSGSVEERCDVALQVLERAGEEAFPVRECLKRGIGEVLLAREGIVVLKTAANAQIVWASDRALTRRALAALGAGGGVTCVLGTKELARDVCRTLRLERRELCSLLVFVGQDGHERLPVDNSRDIRVLGPGYAETILRHYSHPDYLAPGELERMLGSRRVLGGFEDGRLVGFIGEHEDGSLGLLEVFPESRRRGWGSALVATKANRQLAAGFTPWAQVWPGNEASLSLMASLGFVECATGQMWFCS